MSKMANIPQLDGNESFLSQSTVSSDSATSVTDSDQSGQPIQTIVSCDFELRSVAPPVWYDEYHGQRRECAPTRHTIRRNDKLLKCLSLPIISVSNLRSLLPKINSFKKDILERDIGLALLCEIWQVKGKKKNMCEIEKMLEIEGLKYISTPRASYKRGGGCAIVAHLPQFSLEKVDVIIPRSVEVVYGLLRPRNPTTELREIIAVAFYCPPKSRSKSKLLDHIITTVQMLLTKYPRAGIVIGGDRNDMSISPLLIALPRLKQLVSKNTCNGKVLDVLITNLHEYYSLPIIVPPVPADNPNQGKPSDHSVPLARPHTSAGVNQKNEYRTKISRPMPDSGIRKFGQWIINEDWSSVVPAGNSSLQARAMQELLETKVDEIFPTKSVKISTKDKFFITKEIKQLDRQKKRIYRKQGKSQKYLDFLEKYEAKYKKAAAEYLAKNVNDLKKSDPGKAYSILKRMGAQPGDELDDGSFSLTEHLEENLTSQESVNKISEHFSMISQQYPPLNVPSLPRRVRRKLESRLKGNLPYLSKFKVENMIMKAKKTKSGIPGELPKILYSEFAPELSAPLSQIYNTIIQTGNWPDIWKVEYGLPLKKTSNPLNEDEIRIISLTHFCSKVFEKFVISWLMEYLKEHIDWWQYGGQKGSSVSHYLIDFINFIQYNQDIKNIQAVLAVAVDFSKAFNRQNHNILVELLSDLGVPGWLLHIVIGFLEDREMEVNFKGAKSSRRKLPGGCPQGTVLGMFLFLILINGAGFRNKIKNTGKVITANPNKRKPLDEIHLKFIDDMTGAISIDIKDNLERNPEPNPIRPFRYHDRTQHILPEDKNQLQDFLDDLSKYTNDHQMRINDSKTKVILFNNAVKSDFFPNLAINDIPLDVVEELRLLGVMVRSDLSWRSNTSNICQKAYARLWMLRRLKPLGASIGDLVDVYEKQIRCVLEFATAVWTPGLTNDEVNQIERVQKAAFSIILAKQYRSYESALKLLNMETLSDRRNAINLKFAKKCLKNEKYSNWFCKMTPTDQQTKTRSKVTELIPVRARTKTFLKSPIAYLTNLINNEISK